MAHLISSLFDIDRFVKSITRVPNTVALPMDLYRHADSYTAHIEMPGVDLSDIDIDVDGRTLTVRAHRTPAEIPGAHWVCHERASGVYSRRLELGARIDPDSITASYRSGVLTVTIPLSQEAHPRKVHVADEDPSASSPTVTVSTESHSREAE